MLNIIPDEDQVIHLEWLHFYDNTKLPPTEHITFNGTYSGVDLAISLKDTADNTAIVSANIHGRNEKLRIFILPSLINQKIDFPQQVELLKMHRGAVLNKPNDRLFVESVAYQDALPQMLNSQGVDAEAVRPLNDKRTRLALTSTSIKNGNILFPKTGCEQLIEQIVGFGVEKHDDLADAFSLLIHKIVELHTQQGTIAFAIMVTGSDDDAGIVYHSDYYDVLDDYDVS